MSSRTGQQIWVRQVDNDWWLAQVPEVNSALVSLNPQTGAVLGAGPAVFDFNQSKFNRATQALRQVGSNIKPFLYTAAMDKGLTLASMLNDVPISRWDAGAGSDWRPKNSPPQYAGPIRLRQGLGQSKNVVMVRAMRAMGVDYAAEYLQRFGFPAQNIVHTESLALGSASFTPMQVARGYAVMANGGFLIDPYFISKIENDQGGVISKRNRKSPVRSAISRSFTAIRRNPTCWKTLTWKRSRFRKSSKTAPYRCLSWNRQIRRCCAKRHAGIRAACD
nr:penicillin-binding protein 1A [Salmonella sp. NCTC 7297]